MMYAPELVDLLTRADERARRWRRIGYGLMFAAAMVAAGVVL